MEFWGVEVKPGVPLHVDPGNDMIVHISQFALGQNNNNEKQPIHVYLRVGDQKVIIATLSHAKFPQLSTEIVLEKEFELSHTWTNGSVFFTGYKVDASDRDDDDTSDGENAVTANKEPAVAISATKQVNFQLPNEDKDDSDEDSEDDETDEGDEDNKVTAEVESDEDDEDDSTDSDEEEDDSSDEDTPEKPKETKKRTAEATTSKNPASNKKAKFVTPQKTETKKPHVHVATPHPSKQAGKTSGGSNGETSKQQQTPKSAGAFGCNSCNRKFTSEMGLQSHTKAKHT